MPEDLTHSMTILGTPAYMSPEQASGKELDTRTDIWSFGCVLYEALTGKQAFRGGTVTEVLTAVLEREPDWAALPAVTSARLVLLVKRCLRKDPNSRLRDIGDAGIELEDLLVAPAQEESARPAAITRRTAISALSGAGVGAAATGVFVNSRYRGAVPRKLTQFVIIPPESGTFPTSFNKRIAISPDGTRIAFGAEALYMRSFGELESKRIKEAPTGGAAWFSPDSRWIGLILPGNIQAICRLALSGGAPVTLCSSDGFSGGTWGDNGNIYFVDLSRGLMSIPGAGGQPKEVAKPDFSKGEREYKYPCALPGGKAILMTVSTADNATWDDARIVAVSLATGEKKILVEGGTHPRYSASGHLLYARDGKILSVPFDASSLRTQGQPVTVLEGVQMSRNTGVANFDLSADGDLAYIAGVCEGGERTLVWVDRGGNSEPVGLPPRSYEHPRLSPDERLLAIEIEGPSHDLYVYDFSRGVLANITTDGVSHWPVWSPDGSELAYRSGPMGHFTLWRVPMDRSRPPQIVSASGLMQSASSWSPDGHTIAYTASYPPPDHAGTMVQPSILVADVHGDRPAQSFSKGRAPEGSPRFSLDGRWVAYCSSESGKPQVYVQAFPGPGPKIQISNDGGTDPVWKRGGGELFYRNGDSMMAVSVSTSAAFVAGRPQELWRGHYSHGMSSSCGPPGATSSNYDVTADGRRFLMIRDADQDRTVSRTIVVVLGFANELNRGA